MPTPREVAVLFARADSCYKQIPGWRPEVTPREREAIHPALAAWLVEVARRVKLPSKG